ncbi:toxin-antitoxin system YwqK family antitoxin [Gangjinia marincola]|uniref:Toxin-antitoxin system YwqK family antitoxin n=1 Tax=Gangjinia marincola TaxID=578463 RepID=A0ABP3XUN3_9FLAO
MIKHILVLWLFSLVSSAQTVKLNQFDAQGQRHGYWKKTYENSDQIRYEGTFRHGKEVDTFKFYKPNTRYPSALTIFSIDSNRATQIYLAQNGHKISEGLLEGKQRTGTWTYYHEDGNTVMMTEEYTNGQLNGFQITYFPNGKIAEKSNYLNGNLHGVSNMYNDQGTLVKVFTYDKGQLHGETIYYNADGSKSSSGNYKNNKKHGIWQYYKDGKVVKEKKFPLPSGKIEKSD